MFSAGAGTQLVGTGLLTLLGFEASTSGQESRTRLPQRMKSLWAPSHSLHLGLCGASGVWDGAELPGGIYMGSGGEPGVEGQWQPAQQCWLAVASAQSDLIF